MKVVIHNHLPRHKTRDDESAAVLEKQIKFTEAGGKDITDKQRAWLVDAKKRLAKMKQGSVKDTSIAEIEDYYQFLKRMDRKLLEKQVGGRLSSSHLSSESKADLINAALNAKFQRRELEAWGK
jgi:hypothetical protein